MNPQLCSTSCHEHTQCAFMICLKMRCVLKAIKPGTFRKISNQKNLLKGSDFDISARAASKQH